MTHARLPVAVIGAGPVGLAAAVHLLARGELPLILEASPAVGHAVRQWGHVRMFTPWRFCVDRQAGALLTAHGWTPQAVHSAAIASSSTNSADCVASKLSCPSAAPGAPGATRKTAVAEYGRPGQLPVMMCEPLAACGTVALT